MATPNSYRPLRRGWSAGALCVLAAACAPGQQGPTPRAPAPVPVQVNRPELQLNPPPPATPIRLGMKVDTHWVDSTLASLSLEEKVGQLMMPWVLADYTATGSPAYDTLRQWIQDRGIGGVVMSIGAPLEFAQKVNTMQRMARVPLLVASDVEHGTAMRLEAGVVLPYGLDLGHATEFPQPMAIGATRDEKLAYEMGRVTALEAQAAGIQVAFAPIVDVNINPANPIINTRSFGADPQLVARMAKADIRGMQENGLIATAKHFPGHGDTQTDSHLGLPILTITKARADTIELVPFRAAIEQGVAAIMTAHIAFPDITGDTVPATLSPEILGGILRKELGFDGLVFTDALDMGGIVKKYGPAQAAVLAIKAGADVLLMPPDMAAAQSAVVAAVQSGDIPESRLDQSVRKILTYKAMAGLDRQRTVSLERLPNVVGIPAHRALAAEAAEKGLTVGRDSAHLLPVNPANTKRVLSIVYSDDNNPLDGRTLQQGLRGRFPSLQTAYVDTRTTQPQLDSLLAAADSADVVFVSPFVRWRDHKGSIFMDARVADFIQQVAARRPTVVTSFGNPYLLAQFPTVGTYVLAWGPEDVMQTAAVRGLTGQAPITGRLPIPIPPLLPFGAGVQVTATASSAGGSR